MSGATFNSQILRERFRSIWPGDEYYHKGEQPALRIHRAISWVERAEKESGDWDAKFIFYWIAFNAAYAQVPSDQDDSGEKSCFDNYFTNIVKLDTDGDIYDAVWSRFSSSIRSLLSNQFAFQKFWDYQNSSPRVDNWEASFERKGRAVRRALGQQNTGKVLSILFERLYTLRNQLVHGGSSWNSRLSRSQVRDGSSIMEILVPIFINLMMKDPNSDWGRPRYPRVVHENRDYPHTIASINN